MPNVTDTLCLAAKAWSDVCYLDEIQGPCREPLSTADKQAVNRKAMHYAQQVLLHNQARRSAAADVYSG